MPQGFIAREEYPGAELSAVGCALTLLRMQPWEAFLGKPPLCFIMPPFIDTCL